MAGFGRILVAGAAIAVGLGTVALRAQTQLEDPKNAPKIFASTCSACHKSPAGLGKNASASFLRQHYTTGPEMSSAMANYLASAGSGPAAKRAEKNEKQKESPTGSAKTAKREIGPGSHPFTDGSTDVRPTAREKQKAKAEPKESKEQKQAARTNERVSEPPPVPVERPPQSSASAALGTPAAADPGTPPVVTLDIPMPELPTEPPADLAQPPVFSTAPLP